jgi:probable F420-dependent oxidoreductase
MTDELLLGFGLPVSGAWANPLAMLHIAGEAERLGYNSLWTFQRMLRPVTGSVGPEFEAVNNPAAGSIEDAPYHSVHDPLLPLAYVAASTSRIRIGTATICAPFIAPALLAKSVATMDVLSDGRFTLGIGIGWLPTEYAAAGIPYDRRGERMEEYLQCLEALWTQDPVTFAGEFYKVPPSHVGIDTVQHPHPPVLVGGAAPAALRRAGRLAQGWISGTGQDLRSIGEKVDHVRAGAILGGKDPDSVQILVRGVVDLMTQDPGSGRRPLQGTADQIREDLRTLHGQGVTEVFFDLNFSPRAVAENVTAGEAVEYAELVLNTFAPASPAV